MSELKDRSELAVLELFHSRPIAPTRRLALGLRRMPMEPAPGAGSVLLGGIAACYGPRIEDDEAEPEEIEGLMGQMALGQRIVQPRLRHRLQIDRVGLQRAELRLLASSTGPSFEFSELGRPLVYLLAGIYAAGSLPPNERTLAFAAMRKGLAWRGPLGQDFVAYLGARADGSSWRSAFEDPRGWALATLGFSATEDQPTKKQIRSRFRDELRAAHPDHGGDGDAAAVRIAELGEARRLLLGH